MHYSEDIPPPPFKVIATKPLVCYAISKEDFAGKFSADMKTFMEIIARKKYKWIEKRFTDILSNLNHLRDGYFEEITEKSSQVK